MKIKMKKIIISLLSVAAILSGCSKDDTSGAENGNVNTQGVKISAGVVEDLTRVTVDGDTETKKSTSEWKGGDAIGVFYVNNAEKSQRFNIEYTADNSGAQSGFSTTSIYPVSYVTEATTHELLAYYPYVSGNGNIASVEAIKYLLAIPATQDGTIAGAEAH